jgi:hypothetical protein
VKLRRDDWDEDERKALADLGAELERVRARHRDDPPFELLRAADVDALPESLQDPIAEHLKQSAWSRALVEGAADAEAALDPEAERKLLARVTRSARDARTPSRWRFRAWIPAFAAAALLVVMVAVIRREPAPPVNEQPQPSTPGTTAATVPPAFALPLDKPDVKLTQAALVLRSAGRDATFVDDIAPALNAYRANNYAEADRLFAALDARYPNSVEVKFYRGVSRLFMTDAAGAIPPLEAARRVDGGSFAPEIAWYLGVAHERAGDPARARAELDSLCRQTNAFASRACEAAAKLGPK